MIADSAHLPPGDLRAGSGSSFRPDIEGLRALAVLLVICAHFAVPGFSAGFIGVDIFFVISGYLITSILVREHETTDTIALARFYANRLRRLFPALATMLVISCALAFMLLPRRTEPRTQPRGCNGCRVGEQYLLLPLSMPITSVRNPLATLFIDSVMADTPSLTRQHHAALELWTRRRKARKIERLLNFPCFTHTTCAGAFTQMRREHPIHRRFQTVHPQARTSIDNRGQPHEGENRSGLIISHAYSRVERGAPPVHVPKRLSRFHRIVTHTATSIRRNWNHAQKKSCHLSD